MAILNQFRDTIFLKEDSDLEKQLEDLKKIKDNIKNSEEIDKDIKRIGYGIKGENEIIFELKNANLGMYVLHDVTYEHNGNKVQIDFLIFTRGHNYIIECKNLYGNITIDSSGQFFRNFIYDGKEIRESIYSPLTQAKRHQDLLKKIWYDSHNRLDNILLSSKLDDDWFKPLVVLANNKGILNKKDAPNNLKNNIIRIDQLVEYIKNDINNISKDLLCSEKLMKKSAEVWLSRSVNNNSAKVSKYNNIVEIEKNDIEKRLKEFRLEKSEKMNIPPYYVFTDEEMKKIIEKNPKSVEELKGLLLDVKIRYHGADIIKILDK